MRKKQTTQNNLQLPKSTQTTAQIKLNKTLFVNCRKDNVNKYYKIKGILGQGGYGQVYEAVMINNQKCKRAIKTIEKLKIKKLRALQNQIKILTKVDHPSIVKIYQTFEDQQYFHIVMDICEGGELYYYLCENQGLSEKTIRILFRQMLQAVQYCHLNKIAHRDLKPQNFLLLTKDKNGDNLHLKLIDFGFSYEWKNLMEIQIMQQGRTQAVGTPYYVAPQVLQSSGYDHRCDIWSLGVILYIMVTATPPFYGENDVQILRAVKKGSYPRDTPEMKRITFELKDLIDKLFKPVHKRISIKDIFNHPWMKKENLPNSTTKLNFGKLYSFAKYNKLKQISITYIASQLSQLQIIKLGQLFKKIDQDGDGQISLLQFEKCLEQQGNKISLKQIKHLIQGIDTDKDGLVNYSEFVSSCLENLVIFKQQNMINAFRMLDKDQNGKVCTGQLRQLFSKNKQLNSTITSKELDQIIRVSDKNKDGMLDYEQFQRALADRI